MRECNLTLLPAVRMPDQIQLRLFYQVQEARLLLLYGLTFTNQFHSHIFRLRILNKLIQPFIRSRFHIRKQAFSGHLDNAESPYRPHAASLYDLPNSILAVSSSVKDERRTISCSSH